MDKKLKVELNNIPLNHSKNIYLFNADKYRYLYKNYNRKNNKIKIRISKTNENEKELQKNLIIENLTNNKKAKKIKNNFPKIIIEPHYDFKLNSNNNNKEKINTDPYNSFNKNISITSTFSWY